MHCAHNLRSLYTDVVLFFLAIFLIVPLENIGELARTSAEREKEK